MSVESGNRSETVRDPETFIPLTIVGFHSLLSLIDNPSHAYRIKQDIVNFTHGQVQITDKAVSLSLRSYSESGLVEQVPISGRNPNGPMPYTYEITEFGRKVLQLELLRFQSLLNLGREKGLISFNVSTEATDN